MVTTPRTPIRTDRLRPLNAPREIQVQLTDINRNTKGALEGFDVPEAVQLDNHVRSITSIREIWEIEDEWWRNHIARRYFDVILDGGKHLILYQNRLTGKWFAQSP